MEHSRYRSRSHSLNWKPVFLVHTRYRRKQSKIHFELDGGGIQVNLDWLDALLPPAEEDAREDLLIQLGLLAEDAERNVRARQELDLSKCWQALAQAIPDLPWIEERSLSRQIQPRELRRETQTGLYPRILAIQEKLSSFSRGLVADLRRIAEFSDEDLNKTALPVLLGEVGRISSDHPEKAQAVLVQHQVLNPEQCRAVQEGLTRPLTVIQGPPGTGKSTVVRSLLLTQGVAGRTALFASRNHRAVAAVVDELKPSGEQDPVVIADVRDKAWIEILKRNRDATRPANGEDEEPSSLKDLQRQILEQEEASECLEEELTQLYELRDELAVTEGEIHCLREEDTFWEELARKVELDRPAAWVLDLCSRGLQPWWKPDRWFALVRLSGIRRRLHRQFPSDRIGSISDLRHLMRWKDLLHRTAKLEEILKTLRRPSDLGDDWFRAQEKQVQIVHDALPWLPGLWSERLQGKRADLARLGQERNAVRGKAQGGRQRMREVEERNLAAVLPGLPLWTVTNLSAHTRVPLVPGAFELAITDEAAQCDPASVIPLLFRARRAVFVGDPLQLPPVGSIGVAREEEIRRMHGLQDANVSRMASAGRSAWDLAHDALLEQGGQAILLREHYRCDPRIAKFFSREFYESRLRLRTSIRPETTRDSGILWTDVPGGSTTTRGSRWHPPQVDAILEELESLAANGLDGTVGVVTPFREHAVRIRDGAYRRLGSRQLGKWDFASETADGFQGGEKDIILFGLVGGGSGTDATPPFYKRDRNRFNVAVSRARFLLHVFGDRSWARTCGLPVLQNLVAAAEEGGCQQDSEVRRDLIGPVWEPRLARAMEKEGLEFRQQYPACGFYLDFALFRCDGGCLDVEVDGETYHRGRDGGPLVEDLRRDIILRANGWTVQRFWVYELREDLGRCLNQIKDWLKKT